MVKLIRARALNRVGGIFAQPGKHVSSITSIILSGNFIDYTYTFPLIMHFTRRRGNRIAVTLCETNWS